MFRVHVHGGASGPLQPVSSTDIPPGHDVHCVHTFTCDACLCHSQTVGKVALQYYCGLLPMHVFFPASLGL